MSLCSFLGFSCFSCIGEQDKDNQEKPGIAACQHSTHCTISQGNVAVARVSFPSCHRRDLKDISVVFELLHNRRSTNQVNSPPYCTSRYWPKNKVQQAAAHWRFFATFISNNMNINPQLRFAARHKVRAHEAGEQGVSRDITVLQKTQQHSSHKIATSTSPAKQLQKVRFGCVNCGR